MPGPTARDAKAERAEPRLYENVTSPFDGMLNDDITVERKGDTLKVLKGACAKSVAGFERKLPKAQAAVRGKLVELEAAIKEAARLIGEAELPLFGGLATDVEGIRAALAVAERAGGIVDHALSAALYRNLKVLQISGWITSTLTETRNRADLIIVVGDVPKLHPRFMERIVEPPASMFDVTAKKRTVVFIGKGGDAVHRSQAGETVTLPCKIEQAGEVIGTLRARLRGFRIKARKVAGIPLAEIDALAERCRKATYGVVVWAPPLLDFSHAELTVDQLAGLAKDLNQTIRFAGLSLGGARRRHGGRHHDLDHGLSVARELRERRTRLRSPPLRHRKDAGRRGRGSARMDRVFLAGPCAAKLEAARGRARHAGAQARQATGSLYTDRHAWRGPRRSARARRQRGVVAAQGPRPVGAAVSRIDLLRYRG